MPQVQDWLAQTYESNSTPFNASRCVNMFSEQSIPDAKSKSPVGIWMAPGTAPFAACGKGPIINFTTMGGLIYAVTNDSLYQINSNGSSLYLGHTSVSPNGCGIDNNGSTIIWTDGISGWAYNKSTNAVTQIVDDNFEPSNTVTYFDEYFVFIHNGTQEWYISQINWNGTDPLAGPAGPTIPPSPDQAGYNSTKKDATSDPVVAIANSHEQLFVCGEKRIEVWWNAGAAPPSFPFQRSTGAIIQRGLMAPYSIVLEDNTLFFLGDDLIFYRLEGFVPQRVSNHGVEAQWGKYTGLNLTRAFSYTVLGHKLIVITFPAAKATWVYDLNTKRWHERESWTADNHDSSIGRWRVNCAINSSSSIAAYPDVLLGDSLSGRVDQLNNNVFTEFDQTMRALIIGPPIASDRRRVFMKKFEIDVESGVAAKYSTVGTAGVEGGFFALPLGGATSGAAYALSADGNTAVGYVQASGGSPRACYWDGLTGPTVFGPDGSQADGVSNDGSAIVGLAPTGAFYWTASGGFNVFDTGGEDGISADGSRIVGSVTIGTVSQPVYWNTDDFVRRYLPLSLGYIGGGAKAVSADGSFIAGEIYPSSGVRHPFRWTAAGGTIDLGVPPGETDATATGVSDDGMVVGYQLSAFTAFLGRIFTWTPTAGLLTPIPFDQMQGVNAISGDGSTMYGYGWWPDFATSVNDHIAYAKFDAVTTPPPTLFPGEEASKFYDANPGAISRDGMVMAGYSGPSPILPFIYRVPIPATVTAAADPLANPEWRLTVSDDGGRTWSRLVKPRAIGQIGEYRKRLRWLKMGQSRERIIKLECTDPSRRNVIGVYIDTEQGMG